MSDWPGWLRDLAEPAALVSLLATEGSAPRGAGTRMLVTAGAIRGTIGGGRLEYEVIAQARALLGQPPGSWRVQDYPLGPLLGQCCGGRVRLLVEHVDRAALGWLADAATGATLVTTLDEAGVRRMLDPAAAAAAPGTRGMRPGPGTRIVERIGRRLHPLHLFGAGHVGRAVAHHAAGLPFRLAWFDTRPELAAHEGVTAIGDGQLVNCLTEAPPGTAVLVMTHDHGLDYRLVRAALEIGTAGFVGLIGSATKRARFLARLAGDGLPPAARARLTCPIGVAGIRGKEPDVIAVATLAQLLQQLPAAAS